LLIKYIVLYLSIIAMKQLCKQNKMTITIAIKEMKVLNLKRNVNKGYMQGLNIKEYDRINSLHSFLVSTKEGLDALYLNNLLTK
jgi:hypothetical protein